MIDSFSQAPKQIMSSLSIFDANAEISLPIRFPSFFPSDKSEHRSEKLRYFFLAFITKHLAIHIFTFQISGFVIIRTQCSVKRSLQSFEFFHATGKKVREHLI